MAKWINDPDRIVAEELEGLALAYPDIVRKVSDHIIARAVPKPTGHVGLVIGHGAGHEPSMCGFVGKGLLDVDVMGEIFACASGAQILEGIQVADRNGGVVLLVSNHEGDRLNANMAVRLAERRGIAVRQVLLYDDIATAPKGREPERRGIAGLVFPVKMAGAAAEAGAPLDEVVRIAEKARDWTRSLAVARAPGVHPITGQPMFELEPGRMVIGMGVHGERGVYEGPMLSADATMDKVASAILEDLPFVAGDEVIAFLNGLGGTTLMELHLLFRRLAHILSMKSISLYRALIGELITSQETAGFSLSLCKVDEELKALWDAPAEGISFKMCARPNPASTGGEYGCA